MAFLIYSAYANRPSIDGEFQSDKVSIVEPGQTVPLSRIITGLKNGTIILPPGEQNFDIPGQEVDIPSGRTPEATNAAVAAATADYLARTADEHVPDPTSRPNFTAEDALNHMQVLADVINKELQPNGDGDGVQPPAPQSQGGEKPNEEPFGEGAAGTAA